MKLTKKEISKNIRLNRISNITPMYVYKINVRGFYFESRQNGELYEEDETGHCTFVESVNNKREVVDAIYDWFKEYASQEFDD